MTLREIEYSRLEEKDFFLTPPQSPNQSQWSDDMQKNYLNLITPKTPTSKREIACPAAPRRKRSLELNVLLSYTYMVKEKTRIPLFEIRTPKRR